MVLEKRRGTRETEFKEAERGPEERRQQVGERIGEEPRKENLTKVSRKILYEAFLYRFEGSLK